MCTSNKSGTAACGCCCAPRTSEWDGPWNNSFWDKRDDFERGVIGTVLIVTLGVPLFGVGGLALWNNVLEPSLTTVIAGILNWLPTAGM